MVKEQPTGNSSYRLPKAVQPYIEPQLSLEHLTHVAMQEAHLLQFSQQQQQQPDHLKPPEYLPQKTYTRATQPNYSSHLPPQTEQVHPMHEHARKNCSPCSPVQYQPPRSLLGNQQQQQQQQATSQQRQQPVYPQQQQKFIELVEAATEISSLPPTMISTPHVLSITQTTRTTTTKKLNELNIDIPSYTIDRDFALFLDDSSLDSEFSPETSSPESSQHETTEHQSEQELLLLQQQQWQQQQPQQWQQKQSQRWQQQQPRKEAQEQQELDQLPSIATLFALLGPYRPNELSVKYGDDL